MILNNNTVERRVVCVRLTTKTLHYNTQSQGAQAIKTISIKSTPTHPKKRLFKIFVT